MADEEFELDADFTDEPQHAERGGRNFFMGVAVGALLGAGVALLFAPDRGVNTRRKLGRRLRRLRDQGGESVEALRSRFGRELRRLKKRVG